MKIAIVSATYPPYLGGTGNVCASHARELVRLGHDVHIFTAGDPASSDCEAGSSAVYRLRPVLRLGNGVLLPQLAWRLRGFDIIHWHYPFFGGEFTALAAKLTQTPLVITYHQDVILDGWMGRLVSVLEATVSKWALTSAEKILFTSHDYAQHSKLYGQLPRGIVDALANGVDTERFVPSTQNLSYIKEEPFIALLVAGLDAAHYFKGVSNFLQAVAQTDSVHAIIVGDGQLRPAYEQEAQQLGLGERVRFAGRVSDADLPSYYQSADVTVLPSTTMGEAFGLVLVESLASGTPVIASNLPGVRTVVSEPDDGYLVRPNDVGGLAEKLCQMRDLSPQQRQAMGNSGRVKVVKLYDWRAIGRNLQLVYQTLHQ